MGSRPNHQVCCETSESDRHMLVSVVLSGGKVAIATYSATRL